MAKDTYSIIVVDDDPAIRDAIREYLAQFGYDVDAAADGEAAVEAFTRKLYDLMIIDLVLPGMNGIEAIRAIRSGAPRCIFIIMTGYAALDTAVQAVREGAYDYLTKPFKLDELRIAVKNACEKISMERSQLHYIDELRRAHAAASGHGVEAPAGPGAGVDVLGELERLAALLERGAITKEEYEALKARLIAKG